MLIPNPLILSICFRPWLSSHPSVLSLSLYPFISLCAHIHKCQCDSVVHRVTEVHLSTLAIGRLSRNPPGLDEDVSVYQLSKQNKSTAVLLLPSNKTLGLRDDVTLHLVVFSDQASQDTELVPLFVAGMVPSRASVVLFIVVSP